MENANVIELAQEQNNPENMHKYVLKLRMFDPAEGCNLSEEAVKTLLAETAAAYSVKGVREVSLRRVNKAMVAMNISSRNQILDVRRWLVGYSSMLYKKIETLTNTKYRVFTVADFQEVEQEV